MKQQPKRKPIRLSGHNYDTAGYYFITICTKENREILSKIVGTTAPGRPHVELTPIGMCVEETIRIANRNNVKIDKYVIMPNHVQMIVNISGNRTTEGVRPYGRLCEL